MKIITKKPNLSAVEAKPKRKKPTLIFKKKKRNMPKSTMDKVRSKSSRAAVLEDEKSLAVPIRKKEKPLHHLKQQHRFVLGNMKTSDALLTPIDDPDPFYKKKETFIVLNRERLIHRFSEEKSLFLFGRNSAIRLFFIRLLINKWFNLMVILTILVNCGVMIVNGNNKYVWSDVYVENIFVAIYSIEAIVKIVGRGFLLHKFSYLRDLWNWLDFVVILSAYCLLILSQSTENGSGISSITFLRAVRVLRVFKTLSVIPGLRTIVSALIASTKALKDAMLLSILGFSMFSLIGIQLFRGTLRQKCVLIPPFAINFEPNCSVHRVNDTKTTELPGCMDEEGYRKFVKKSFTKYTYEEVDFVLKLISNQSELLEQTNGCSVRSTAEVLPYVSTYSNTSFFSYKELNETNTTNSNESTGFENYSFYAASSEKFDPIGYNCSNGTWNNSANHFLMNTDLNTFQLCGKATTDNAFLCPKYTECLAVGNDPNYGYTNFNNFFYSFLSIIRLSLQDNWEELYLQVLETSGMFSWFFFLLVIFLGSYYLINLILAVVATSYEEERKNVESSLEEERKENKEEKEILEERKNAKQETIQHNAMHTKLKRKRFRLKLSSFSALNKNLLKWDCCVGDNLIYKIRVQLQPVLSCLYAEYFTISLVLMNTLVMALEQEPKDEKFDEFLEYSNTIFTGLFTVEVILKMFAFSPYNYFCENWNVFDFSVVTISLLEWILKTLPQGLTVFRVFRIMRLVRILKLAKTWSTLGKLMKMVADSLSKVGYLTIVLLVVLVIFALAGMQTVGNDFHIDKETGLPLRWHMHDFTHSFLVVFRIQCGEWVQNMWSCMHSVEVNDNKTMIPFCLVIFLGMVFVGNLVVLNLFLALLLNSFNSEALKGNKKSTARLLYKSLKQAGKKVLEEKKQTSITNLDDPELGYQVFEEKYSEVKFKYVSVDAKPEKQPREFDFSSSVSEKIIALNKETEFEDNLKAKIEENSEKLNFEKPTTVNPYEIPMERSCNNNSIHTRNYNPVVITEPIVKLFPKKKTTFLGRNEKKLHGLKSKLHCWQKCRPLKDVGRDLREIMGIIVNHKIFETFIIFVITASSVALVFEDRDLEKKKDLKEILEVLDKIFTAIFIAEMLMKLVGCGLKKYFTDWWCLLDFIIVLISVTSLIMESSSFQEDFTSLRVLRSLRAFRPLRAMSRFQGIKVVTDALFRSIPAIANVFLICLIFWLVFAIMGVNLFAGKMASCVWKETNQKVWSPEDFKKFPTLTQYYNEPPIEVTNKSQCLKLAELTGNKVEWRNLLINFDNTAVAYVSLLQVATFKGWMPIMYAAVDSPKFINDQPIRDNDVYKYFFFVCFIIFGAFFTLNLFISVVIDNFNQQKNSKDLREGELLITESQKKAHSAMKKLKMKLPKQLFAIPKSCWRKPLYMFVTSDKFELGVLIITMINLITMAVEHEGMSEFTQDVLEYISYGFVLVFTFELALRITAMGKSYFYIPWNIFDFLLIGISLLLNVITVGNKIDSGSDTPLISTSPWLPILRLIRVVRILRVARVASGIRTLLFALMLSIPALFNVGSLLFLVMFIYAVVGISEFGSIQHNGVVNDVLNFESFPNAFLLLFQMSTSAGWDGFMAPTVTHESQSLSCTTDTCASPPSRYIGYIYFISYLLITFVIVTNMYIAIILENFELASRDNEEELTADDFEHFFDTWQKYDTNGNGKLSVDGLSNLLDAVDEPLKIRKPNMAKIADMQIPLYDDNELHILDVASALIKRILGTDGISPEMEAELKEYFKSHANNFRDDNARLVSNTKEYICKLHHEGKGEMGYMARKIQEGLYYQSSKVRTKALRVSDGMNPSGSTSLTTSVDVHLSEEPEVVISSLMEICKMATVVRPSRQKPSYVEDTPSDISNQKQSSLMMTNETQQRSLAKFPKKKSLASSIFRKERKTKEPTILLRPKK